VIEAGLAATGQKLASQATILGFLAGIHRYRSVVDFGCGTASWLHAARQLGANEIRGYDGIDMPIEARGLKVGEFIAADLNRFVELEKTFDLAICLEGTHQVDGNSAENLVRTLCAASPWVLFGASVPYQNGERQPAERWMESWAKLFLDNGYVCYDILRKAFWHDTRVAFYYRQSACLYVRPGAHYALKARAYYPTRCPPSLIHPELFLKIASWLPNHGDVAVQVRALYRAAGMSAAAAPHGAGNEAIAAVS
jgi:SAM-dependent methyltransferase